MTFQENIQNWVALDNKIKKLNSETRALREQKNIITSNIFDYAESNNLQNAIIEITDGKLKFQQSKSSSPLTFKFVENCLNECIKNEEQVKMIIKFIKQKREFKYSNDIRRSYK
tara:strand:+ start:1872 stop:2213 length:342 start_codon:yes stop_codon:yes gene_type:complete